jgi:hypothetical protein
MSIDVLNNQLGFANATKSLDDNPATLPEMIVERGQLGLAAGEVSDRLGRITRPRLRWQSAGLRTARQVDSDVAGANAVEVNRWAASGRVALRRGGSGRP